MRRDAMANRERVLDAAEQVFAEAGRSGSTEDVAARAGVGIGTVFRHFPTKQALVEATIVRHFEHLTEHVTGLADAHDPAEAFDEAFRALVLGAAPKLAMIELLLETGGFTDPVTDAATRLRAAMGALLDNAHAAGAVRADVAIDEVYLLIRAMAQASAAAPSSPSTLDAALAIVRRGLHPD